MQEFLGFTFNSKQMQISMPQKKMSKLMSRIKQLFKDLEVTYSCRWMASLLGKITAMIPAIGEALLRIRFLQRGLAMNLRRQQYNWEKLCPLSAQSWNELQWWTENVQISNGLPIKIDTDIRELDISIHVEASDTEWGITSKEVETYGFWSEVESGTSISLWELKTILFALQLHAQKFRNSLIHMYIDNMAVLKHVKKSGGTTSALLQTLSLEYSKSSRSTN